MLHRVLAPGRLGGLRLPHRIVMGAMHLGIEDSDDRLDAFAEFYAARARGGAGLMITGGSAVSRVAAGGRHYSVVSEEPDQQRLAAVAARVHAEGGLIALQLFHAGRYARREDFGLQPVAPSAIPSRFSREPPRALDADGIADTIADFAAGARAARRCGFDAVELMGSEGYLLNEFCSPLTNTRDDAWGGDAERRRAFPLAVVAAVRAAAGPDFPVIYRISGDDLMPGSSTPAETVALARALADAGVDALNVGLGWHESAVPTVQLLVPPGTWTPEAARIKQAVGDLPVITGNRINRLAQAEEVLDSGAADFVSMSRPMLADPNLMRAGRDGDPVNICIGCDQACIDRSLVDERVSCLVNPGAGHEAEPLPAPTERRRFLVIGGGPAGLATAREWAMRGQRVTLLEAADELGGQFRLARMVPGKGDYGGTIDYYAAELRRLGVDVRVGCRVDPDDVAALVDGVAGVVLATGVRPRQASIEGLAQAGSAGPALAGSARTGRAGSDLASSALAGSARTGRASIEQPRVLTYPEAFHAAAGFVDPAKTDPFDGPVAIIGGGGIAVDLAHLLCAGGRVRTPAEFRAAYGIDATHGGVTAGAADGTLDGSSAGAPRLPVTIMRRSGRIGAGMGRTMRWPMVAELRRSGVRMMTGVQYRRVDPDGVWVTGNDGDELIPARTVVVAAGQEPETGLVPALDAAGVPYRCVGGARSTDHLDAVRAFAEGVGAARTLMERTLTDRTLTDRTPMAQTESRRA